MAVECSLAVQPSYSSSAKAPHKIPIGKSANFAEQPLWLSLKRKSSPSSLKIQQERNGRLENVHLVSLSKQGKLKEASECLEQMIKAGALVDPYSYKTLFEKCGKFKSLVDGRLTHEQFRRTVKNPFGFLENSVLKKYCACGNLVDANRVLDEMVSQFYIEPKWIK